MFWFKNKNLYVDGVPQQPLPPQRLKLYKTLYEYDRSILVKIALSVAAVFILIPLS